MAPNYTLQDMLGIVTILPAFSLVLLMPGYMVGLATDILKFRTRGVAERTLLSLVLSCAISPYIINLLCRFIRVASVSACFILIGLSFLAATLTAWRREGFRIVLPNKATKAAIFIVALWCVVCLISLSDLQLGVRVYSTVATFDHAVRSAFIASALRTGAPPANPFFYPGHFVHARYYYYWNVLCAVIAYLSRSSPRITLYGSCFWSGLCLAAIIPIYLKHFLEKQSKLGMASVLGLCLIAITGLDIIPTAILALVPNVPIHADMEWWNPGQITSWLDSLIWVPHHVASLVACLVGFLLLSKAASAKTIPRRCTLVLIAAVAYSSAAGLSVYVTLTFVIFELIWTTYLLARRSFLGVALHFLTGLLTVLLSLGYIGDLLGHGSGQQAGSGSFVALTLLDLPHLFNVIQMVLGAHNKPIAFAMQVIFRVLSLFLELGVYFAVAMIQFKHDWKHRRTISEPQKGLWMMAFASLFVVLFLRSTVISSNDLAWRGSLVLQFVLLLWTAIYLSDRILDAGQGNSIPWTSRIHFSRTMIVLLALGGASSLYQLTMLRIYPTLLEKFHWENSLLLPPGAEAYSIRNAYADLNRSTPLSAIVQYNPESKSANQFEVYSRNQAVDGFAPGCATTFGGSSDDCRIIEDQLREIFNPGPGVNPTQKDVSRTCQTLKIDLVVVNANDPIWKVPGSWIWQTAPMIQNDFVRIYQCNSTL